MTSSDRQRHAVIVAAAVLALLALAGAGVLLLRGSDAQAPVARPTTDTSPSATPSSAPPPEPSPTPTPSPSPSAGTWEPSDAFLTPEQASQAEGSDWALADFSSDPEPLLDPCGGDGVPQAEAVDAEQDRALTAEREIASNELLQEVYRYAGEQDAAAAFATYRQRVEACPRTPLDEGDEIESSIVTERSSDDRLLVRQRYCNPECTDLFTRYAMVARSGAGLTVLRYAIGEDGDPAEPAGALLDAAAEALAAAVRG